MQCSCVCALLLTLGGSELNFLQTATTPGASCSAMSSPWKPRRLLMIPWQHSVHIDCYKCATLDAAVVSYVQQHQDNSGTSTPPPVKQEPTPPARSHCWLTDSLLHLISKEQLHVIRNKCTAYLQPALRQPSKLL